LISDSNAHLFIMVLRVTMFNNKQQFQEGPHAIGARALNIFGLTGWVVKAFSNPQREL